MIIDKLKITNFKKFMGEKTIKFNKIYNIFIGDNEAGKSTILTALDIVFSGSSNKVESIGLENLFNIQVVNDYLNGSKEYKDLPKLIIEVFFEATGNSDLDGENHSEGNVSKDGIKFECVPNEEYSKEIMQCLKAEESIFPFEFYQISFKTFAKIPYNSYRKYAKHILIDNTLINNEYAMKEYTNSMYNSYADIKTKNVHKNEFRRYKSDYASKVLKEFNDNLNKVKFGIATHNKLNFENSITIFEDEINIENKGKGRQCVIKTEFALSKQIDNIDFILIEEPENHLSHMNMRKLLKKILETSGKQLFITTHNSMICSRMNLKNLICMSSVGDISMDFANIENDTAKFFMKMPSNNILNFILSKKVILVEGAAEYILMEKFFKVVVGENIENNNINIISVNGLSFKRYLEIAKILEIRVAVITDNDSNYRENVVDKYSDFVNDNIKVFSDENDSNSTFEICLYKDNIKYIESCNITSSKDKQKFMLNNKSESAYRILEKMEEQDEKSQTTIKIPYYIEEAIKWIKN